MQNEHRQAEKDLALRVHKFGDWATSTSGGQQRQVSASSSTRACLVQNTPASIMALALIMSLCLTFPWTSFKKATPFMSVFRVLLLSVTPLDKVAAIRGAIRVLVVGTPKDKRLEKMK